MSGLDNMRTRIGYLGGSRQVERMNEDKLRTLKKALLYSYQSATAILQDGRKFRCLINPDQIKNQYDNKFISIPFEDICLNEQEINPDEIIKIKKTTEGLQEIGMKPGDVFTWDENQSDWLVYLRRLEETAYFRAEIRRCRYTVDIEGQEYKCYASRPSVNLIDWRQQEDKVWNDLDYDLEMYITKDEITEAFLHRFTIVKVNNKPWQVQAVDNISSEGIIILALKEYYQNTIAEEKAKEDIENELEIPVLPEDDTPAIEGPIEVYPYDKKTYTIKNAEGGAWSIGGSKAKILYQDTELVKIEVVSGRSGEFELKYLTDTKEEIILKVIIKSL